MRIRTNTGIVELTAEMVTKGMVLQGPVFRHTIARKIVPSRPDLIDTEGRAVMAFEVPSMAFLGCDPTIATRADCERYGVHGDAAAHGFAKLRDGGAVDLAELNHVPGMVFDSSERMGGRCVIIRDFGDGNWTSTRGTSWHLWKAVRAKQVRFIGLAAGYASPDDVDRLCCGARREAVTKSVRASARCTLAIGDHNMHEDLSIGVRWNAAMRISGFGEIRTFTLNPWADDAVGIGESGAGETGFGADADTAILKKPYDPAPLLAMQLLANGTGDMRVIHRTPCPECHAEVLCPNGTYHHDHCPVTRRAREAPIVALVNAVPEGLDPIGWRAAVLAVDEAHSDSDRMARARADKRISDPSGQWLAANVNKPCDLPDWSVNRIMHDAYHRAVTPRVSKTAERKQKTLSIRLPDDDDFGW